MFPYNIEANKMFKLIAVLIGGASALTCGSGNYLKAAYRRRRMNRTRCAKCPQGQYKMFINHEDDKCDSCESGLYQDQSGKESCKGNFKCFPGKYGKMGSTSSDTIQCILCSAGQYSPIQGMGQCNYCPSGKYTESVGMSDCIGISICPSGKWLPSGLTIQMECKLCDIGKFSSGPGKLVCAECPSGKYIDVTGSSKCIDEPKCRRWFWLNKIEHICYEIYDMKLYKILVTMYWTNVLISIISLCRGISYKSELVRRIRDYLFIVNIVFFGMAVWLTSPSPLNLTDGMSEPEYAVLMGLIGLGIVLNLIVIFNVEKAVTVSV